MRQRARIWHHFPIPTSLCFQGSKTSSQDGQTDYRAAALEKLNIFLSHSTNTSYVEQTCNSSSSKGSHVTWCYSQYLFVGTRNLWRTPLFDKELITLDVFNETTVWILLLISRHVSLYKGRMEVHRSSLGQVFILRWSEIWLRSWETPISFSPSWAWLTPANVINSLLFYFLFLFHPTGLFSRLVSDQI